MYNFDYECRRIFTKVAMKYLNISPLLLDDKKVLTKGGVKICIDILTENNIFTEQELRSMVKLPEGYYKH